MMKLNLRLAKRIGMVLRWLGLYPLAHRTYQRLFQSAVKNTDLTYPGPFRPTELAQLTPNARKIYQDLRSASETLQRDH